MASTAKIEKLTALYAFLPFAYLTIQIFIFAAVGTWLNVFLNMFNRSRYCLELVFSYNQSVWNSLRPATS